MAVVQCNCSIPKNNVIKEIVHHGGHQLILLPTYTLELNSIRIKSENYMKIEMLLNCIQIKFQEIKPENCIAFYYHVQEYLVKGLAREKFNSNKFNLSSVIYSFYC